MTADEQQRLYCSLVFVDQPVEQFQIAAEVEDIFAGDIDVGLGTNHFDLAQQVVDERPGLGHPLQPAQSGAGGDFFAECSADTKPAGEHEAEPRPTATPAYPPKAFQ